MKKFTYCDLITAVNDILVLTSRACTVCGNADLHRADRRAEKLLGDLIDLLKEKNEGGSVINDEI